MTRSRIIAVTLALVASSAGCAAFVSPAPLNSCPAGTTAGSSSKKGNKCDVQPQSRQAGGLGQGQGRRAEAVGPLDAAGFSLESLTESLTNFFGGGFRESETTLPQDPKANKAARKKQLADRQKEYRWSTERIPVGTPYLEGFPPSEQIPTVPWIAQIAGSLVRIVLGTIRGTIGVTEIIEAVSDPGRARTFAKRIRELISDATVNERPVDIEDYEELHAFPIKTPNSVYDYEDDDAFARLRLQGANCVVLEKCSQATRKKLNVLDSDPAYKDLKQKVDSLLKNGKLYVVDHELLADMPPSPLDDIPRYLAPSIALFEVVDDDLLPIRAIGIQLSQGEEATPIFTPDEGYNWMIAKACFEAAEFIIHEVVSHLGNTHIVLEGPVVAMNRQLPKEHPLYALMQPHLEGTAFINWAAQELLIQKGGAVDRLQANDIEDSWSLVLAQTLKRISKDFSPEADMAARQITKEDFPGRYPYRDFGLQYWEATHTWVKEYLDLYYKSDDDMVKDYELNAFIDEMTDIAQMKWLDDFKTTDDKKGLVAKVMASIIYSASTLHAAVNFPQKTSMSFIPSCPGSMFVAPPTDKNERSFEDYLAYLPPMEIATTQVTILTLLGSVFHTKLSDYETDQFTDDRVREPLSKFQQAVEDIEADIIDANSYIISSWRKKGKDKKDANNFGYTTLLPDNIPQSTNI